MTEAVQRSKTFRDVRFSPEVIRSARSAFVAHYERWAEQIFEGASQLVSPSQSFSVGTRDGNWSFDEEVEFFTEYRALDLEEYGQSAYYRLNFLNGMVSWSLSVSLSVSEFAVTSDVSVEASDRAKILEVMDLFEAAAQDSQVPSPPSHYPEPELADVEAPSIFIGHGHDPSWRDLRDHLRDLHHFDVDHFERHSRVGYSTSHVLGEMLNRSNFAVLVMSAEDSVAGGGIRARQNVVHEAGLFQGRLGFSRAIVVLQEGVEEFSNIVGLTQLRYESLISEVFGDVVAAVRREFPG